MKVASVLLGSISVLIVVAVLITGFYFWDIHQDRQHAITFTKASPLLNNGDGDGERIGMIQPGSDFEVRRIT
jgi:hypothetical protein